MTEYRKETSNMDPSKRAQELRELFIADGIEDIYIAGWNEAEQALDDISSERRRRYLYLVRIPD